MNDICNLQKLYLKIIKNSDYGYIKYKKFKSLISKSKLKGELKTKEIIHIFIDSEIVSRKSKRVLNLKWKKDNQI